MNHILVTGGAGYIGSHTVLELLKLGENVVVIDDLSNSSKESLNRVETLSGKAVTFFEGSILDQDLLVNIFSQFSFSSVIHFAGHKAVGESVNKPLSYYHNNVQGTVSLVEVMEKFNVNNLVFSSSATVYGEGAKPPYIETQTLGCPTSPYGQTKLMVERILADVVRSNSDFKVANLRYFNPIGADESGQIGEDPNGIPNNLMPFVAQVAVGKRAELSIFGNDYATEDGTCERDYIHVTDLAQGHVAALNWLVNQAHGLCEAFNLGTGTPYSVLKIVKSFEQYTKVKVPFKFVPRRDGDLDAFWANADKAADKLNWQAHKTMQDMMEDTWRWQSNNPNGYNA
ncbi:UDP-glucose 4-epimerase GalE [Colwellia sp. E2M01]|uniref:UDP-glucose 4-epimerase GalE n=1 Tax=Colwellia sp. E2M01 TaxID=2841561 RepID=UPI001C08FEFC|nr:UDP-glucose 4-epimerase GalE [Colwellia sp. E2M01]MBU2872073.1 UDP-glucose 4-epimerase GalE [Colwellia sp. E2M01]